MPVTLTRADKIRNRACGFPEEGVERGDRLLSAVIMAHSLIMNGGVGHALECLDDDELKSASDGYAYLGLPTLRPFFAAAQRLTDQLEAADDEAGLDALEVELNRDYDRQVPSDGHLTERFEAVLASRPQNFAPLDE